jgi:hypothetical protein
MSTSVPALAFVLIIGQADRFGSVTGQLFFLTATEYLII